MYKYGSIVDSGAKRRSLRDRLVPEEFMGVYVGSKTH